MELLGWRVCTGELDLEVTWPESCQNHTTELIRGHSLLSWPNTDAIASTSVIIASRNWIILTGFNLDFPDYLWLEQFSPPCVYLFIFFCEVSIQVFYPQFNFVIFFFLLHCYSSLRISNTSPLSDCKYFLPFCGLSFHILKAACWWAEVWHFDEIQCASFL